MLKLVGQIGLIQPKENTLLIFVFKRQIKALDQVSLMSSAWPRIVEELEKLLGKRYTSKQLKSGGIT